MAKILIRTRAKKTPITSGYKTGLVSIWWYTDHDEFWDYSTDLNSAVESNGYLQYSNEKNHLNLWRSVVAKYIESPSERQNIINNGYKSIERGRVIFNIRTQSYEIICSEALCQNAKFRENCIKYFNLAGNRYDFVPLHHYGIMKLTGNPALDQFYYETDM